MVGIYLPMIPQVVVAMLACARIGAVHNVVFGGFSAEAVRERMEFSEAKALVTVDGARRKGKTAPVKARVDEAMAGVGSIETIFVVRHTGEECEMREGRDVWFEHAMEAAEAECPAEPIGAEDPLFILYTSGSTAKPKGILHTTGGYLTGVAWTHRNVFDLKPDEDVYWCAADVGWVTGHSYIVYGPLANGATSVMYEGAPDYPDKDVWWEPDRALRGDDPLHRADGDPRLHEMGRRVPRAPRPHLAAPARLGRRADQPEGLALVPQGDRRRALPDRRHLVADRDRPDHDLAAAGDRRDQAGLGDAAAAGDRRRGRRRCRRAGRGRRGAARPAPPLAGHAAHALPRATSASSRPTSRASAPGTYLVGDAARRDEDGYFWVLGRIDDVVNVSGHRLSTAEVESAIVSHPKVAEAAVIGQSDEDTGQAICAFVTLEGDREGDDEMVAELSEHVAARIGKLARPKRVIWSGDLPKTRSGKIMRRLLRDIAEGRELGDVTTLRDPGVMQELESKVAARADAEG